MVQIHDLNGAGEVLVGQIPDPDGAISQDHFERGPLPASASSLRIDAEAELFGGFDGGYVGGGARISDGPAVRVHSGLREHAAELALACTGALSLDPARPPFGFGSHDGYLDAVHQYIHFRDVPFGNQRQNELFGAPDLLLVPLGDLRANGLCGAFDGFGGDVQPRQQLHRLARRSKRHLTAHHSFHAPYARRGFQASDTQFRVNRILSLRAIDAQEIGAPQLDRPQHGQYGLGTQFFVVGRATARTGNRPVVLIRRIVAQQLRQRGGSGLVHGGPHRDRKSVV